MAKSTFPIFHKYVHGIELGKSESYIINDFDEFAKAFMSENKEFTHYKVVKSPMVRFDCVPPIVFVGTHERIAFFK